MCIFVHFVLFLVKKRFPDVHFIHYNKKVIVIIEQIDVQIVQLLAAV